MFKHIVMWKLKQGADAQQAYQIKQALEALVGLIDGLLELEVGLHEGGDANAYDIVLYSVFRDRQAYSGYQQHPAHQAVVPMVKTACDARACVDFDVE